MLLIFTFFLFFTKALTQDSNEPNNAFAQATPLPQSGSISATIHQNGDRDYYKITLAQAGVLSIGIPLNTSNMRLQINMYLENTTSEIANGIASTNGGNIKVEAVAPAGTYYVLVTDYNGGSSTTPYSINVEIDVSDKGEWNNTFATAYEVTPNTSIQAKIRGVFFPNSYDNDIEYYKIKLEKAGVLSVNIPLHNAGFRLNVLIIHENTNDVIHEALANSANGTVTSEAILKAGTYYVRVHDYNGGLSENPFTINFNFDDTDKCEWNNNFTNACQIDPNSIIKAKIRGFDWPAQYDNDIDYYKVVLPQAGVLVANIPTNNTGQRLYIHIYAENTTDEIISALASERGGAVTTEAVVPAGTYFVRVYDYNGVSSTEQYTLNVSFDISDPYEWNNTYGTATPINNDISIQAKIRGDYQPAPYDPDVDYYKISLAQKTTLKLNIPTNLTGQRLTIGIFNDATTQQLDEVRASVVGGAVNLEKEYPAGIYIIGVWNYNGSGSDKPYILNIGNPQANPTCALPQVTPSAANITTTGAVLNTGLSGFSTYEFNYRKVGDANWTTVSNSTGTLTLTNLTPSTQYEFQVRVRCSNNVWSTWSTTQKFSTSAAGENNCILPQSNPSASGITATGATLNSGLTGFNNYEFNYRVVGSSTWATRSSTTGTTTLSGLTASTQYEFQIRVQCANNTWSTWSSSQNFATPSSGGTGNNSCTLPQNFQLTVSDIETTSAKFAINSSGGDGFELSITVKDANTWSSNNSNATSISLNNLKENTEYEVRARIKCPGNTTSDWSTVQSFKTKSSGGTDGGNNGGGNSQEGKKLIFYISKAEASSTDTAMVHIRVKNFINIGGFQFSIVVPSGKANIVGATTVSALSNLQMRQVNPQTFGFIWFDPELEAKTLPDSSIVITLKLVFNSNIADNECIAVSFSDTPTDIVATTLVNKEVGEFIPTTLNGELCLLSTAVIKGKVLSPAGQGIANVVVKIDGKTSITNDNGEYSTPKVLRGKNHKMSMEKKGSTKNGVNVVDVVTIRQHILGDKPFDTPFKFIAADVNFSTSVNVADVVIIQQLILGVIDSFAKNWVFIPKSHTFSSPANAIKETYPEQINYDKLNGDKNDQDFTGVKMGDVNTSASLKNRIDKKPGLFVQNQQLTLGQTLEIPVQAGFVKGIQGFQCRLHVDPSLAEIVAIHTSAATKMNSQQFNLKGIENGNLDLLWMQGMHETQGMKEGEVLFTLQIRAKKHTSTAALLSLMENDYENLFVNADQEPVRGKLYVQDVLVGDEAKVKFYPNPVSTEINLALESAYQGTYEVQILDSQQRLIRTYQFSRTPGQSLENIDQLENLNAGVLLYRVVLGKQVIHGKFVKLVK
jgi:hypothetical protein